MSEPQPSNVSTTPPSPPETPPEAKRPGLASLLQSVVAAAFGVQSEKKREQDFQHGKPGDYIALGIVFVIVFIITLAVIVNMVLDSAAK